MRWKSTGETSSNTLTVEKRGRQKDGGKGSEGGSVADHLNEFNTVTNKLSFVKVDFDDEVMGLLILFSLP
jgi:hypothetical protein